MTTTLTVGRLGNQFIRNLAVSIIAKKHDLHVNYCSYELIKQLGIELYVGSNKYNKTWPLTDNNYFDVLNSESIDYNLHPNSNYFQTQEISNFLYKYLKTKKDKIIESNPYKDRFENNNDIFIHVRLGDVIRFNPGYDYYKQVIDSIMKNNIIDNIYIASDSPDHEIVTKLLGNYKNSHIVDKDEINTIQFGSTCKHIILSHGSFSAIIGWLGYYSTIYYKKYDKMWHGDMFSIDGWNEI